MSAGVGLVANDAGTRCWTLTRGDRRRSVLPAVAGPSAVRPCPSTPPGVEQVEYHVRQARRASESPHARREVCRRTDVTPPLRCRRGAGGILLFQLLPVVDLVPGDDPRQRADADPVPARDSRPYRHVVVNRFEEGEVRGAHSPPFLEEPVERTPGGARFDRKRLLFERRQVAVAFAGEPERPEPE